MVSLLKNQSRKEEGDIIDVYIEVNRIKNASSPCNSGPRTDRCFLRARANLQTVIHIPTSHRIIDCQRRTIKHSSSPSGAISSSDSCRTSAGPSKNSNLSRCSTTSSNEKNERVTGVSSIWSSVEGEVIWTTTSNLVANDEGSSVRDCPNNLLKWRLLKDEWKRIQTYSPKLRVDLIWVDESGVYVDTKKADAWAIFDLRDINQSSEKSIWLKVNGMGKSCELNITASLLKVTGAGSSNKNIDLKSIASNARKTSNNADFSYTEEQQPCFDDISALSNDETNLGHTASVLESIVKRQTRQLLDSKCSKQAQFIGNDNAFEAKQIEPIQIQIGDGKDEFLLHLSILDAADLHHLVSPTAIEFRERNIEAWLSFELFEQVLQSEMFTSFEYPAFQKLATSFLLRGVQQEVENVLKNTKFVVHLCIEKQILGSTVAFDLKNIVVASTSIRQTTVLFSSFQGKLNNDEYSLVEAPNSYSNSPRISFEISFLQTKKALNGGIVAHQYDGSTKQTKFSNVDRGDEYLNQQHSNSMRDWETWRHKEEIAWHEKLRAKEVATIRALEERAKVKELEQSNILNIAQQEYSRLEIRLKKALSEVENRERQVLASEMSRQAAYSQKLSDLQIQQRRLKDEANYLVELEKTKLVSALGRAATAESLAETTEKKLRKLEQDFDEFKENQRRKPEAILLQENATLRAQLAEKDALIMKERAEKNESLLEKEKLREYAHNLANTLQREKNKSAAQVRKDLEQLRLEYVAKEQRFVMDGERNELRRLRDELESLNKAELTSPCKKC